MPKATKIVASAEGRTFLRLLWGPVDTDRYNRERIDLQYRVRNMPEFRKTEYEDWGWEWEP